jgi:ADP-ribosylglycohydrolase
LRWQRALRSLDGLSVGDAFGQCFFAYVTDAYVWEQRLVNRQQPPGKWIFTDDTVMAIGILEVLARHQRIDQDDLAETFARQYARDDRRGYGGTAHRILHEIGAGVPWREASSAVFGGMGSLGNGGAMRVAPLGAYFGDELRTLIEQARLSAEVTHFHPEGQAGAIAVAVAAAFAAQLSSEIDESAGKAMLRAAIDHTPDSRVRVGLLQALDLPRSFDVVTATSVLGDGTQVSAPDTVPFALWCAPRHLNNYEEAIWTTVSGAGDIDTNCAIVGGIVALSASEKTMPPEWLSARETPQLELP